MKKITVVFISSLIALGACKVQKANATYEFPPEMMETVKVQFAKDFEKGKVLYGINCSPCHNTVVKRKEVIPDFSPEKLVGYDLRIMNPKHEGNLPDERVTAEELVLINTFLTYKKKNKTGS